VTDPELRQLALDCVAGKVFGSWQLSDPDLLPVVFPILALMDESSLKHVRAAAHVYEYLDKAGPWAVNGLPSFLSARLLSADEWATMSGYARELLAQREAFLKGDP
jgi:hypothetical protein